MRHYTLVCTYDCLLGFFERCMLNAPRHPYFHRMVDYPGCQWPTPLWDWYLHALSISHQLPRNDILRGRYSEFFERKQCCWAPSRQPLRSALLGSYSTRQIGVMGRRVPCTRRVSSRVGHLGSIITVRVSRMGDWCLSALLKDLFGSVIIHRYCMHDRTLLSLNVCLALEDYTWTLVSLGAWEYPFCDSRIVNRSPLRFGNRSTDQWNQRFLCEVLASF